MGLCSGAPPRGLAERMAPVRPARGALGVAAGAVVRLSGERRGQGLRLRTRVSGFACMEERKSTGVRAPVKGYRLHRLVDDWRDLMRRGWFFAMVVRLNEEEWLRRAPRPKRAAARIA